MPTATVAAANVFWLLVLSPGSAAASIEPHARGEVRSPDRTIQRLVTHTKLRSPTFAELVGCVEHANVIVYIVPAASLRRSLSAALQLSTAGSGSFRYLRIAVRPGVRPARRVADLAHELAHVCEAVRAGALTSSAALHGYFRDRTIQGDAAARAVYETAAGQRAAADVLRELAEDVQLVAQSSAPARGSTGRPPRP